VDPDVDRLSLVDGGGEAVGEDLTLALCTEVVLGREWARGPVVTNLSTSQVVEDVARAAGVPCFRAPVGEVNVARRMQAEGAVVGGEGNGGIILPRLHFTRDAPLGVALILQHLMESGRSLAEAVDRWPRYRIVKEKAPFPRERIPEGYAALVAELGDGKAEEGSGVQVDRTDGIRLSWPHRREWLHIRPSGTEPVVRFIAEAPDEDQAADLVRRGREILASVGS